MNTRNSLLPSLDTYYLQHELWFGAWKRNRAKKTPATEELARNVYRMVTDITNTMDGLLSCTTVLSQTAIANRFIDEYYAIMESMAFSDEANDFLTSTVCQLLKEYCQNEFLPVYKECIPEKISRIEKRLQKDGIITIYDLIQKSEDTLHGYRFFKGFLCSLKIRMTKYGLVFWCQENK